VRGEVGRVRWAWRWCVRSEIVARWGAREGRRRGGRGVLGLCIGHFVGPPEAAPHVSEAVRERLVSGVLAMAETRSRARIRMLISWSFKLARSISWCWAMRWGWEGTILTIASRAMYLTLCLSETNGKHS
jgi:hypothetical protein